MKRYIKSAKGNPKNITVYVSQEYVPGYGWEDIVEYDDMSSESLKEAKQDVKDYLDNGYNAILDSPEWSACREWVFANKGRYCAYCKRGRDLRVHHKYYLKYPDGEHIKPWEYNIDCYMVLCDDCHKKVHEKYQIKTYYIRRG